MADFIITGIARDVDGNPVEGAVVKSYKTATDEVDGEATSESDGSYEVTVDNDDEHYVVAYLAGSPTDIAGTTVNTLVPVSGGYVPLGVTFDGTNDYMSRGGGLTGASDGKKFLCSFWVKFNGGDGNFQEVFEDDSGGITQISRFNSNKMYITFKDTPGTGQSYGVTSTTTFDAAAGWKHVLIASDQASGSPYAYFYVNGVADATPSVDGSITIDWTKADWFLGSRVGGTLKCNMDIADFYLAIGQSLDISNPTNLAKFYDGGPVDLGSDGSTPTGTAPTIFFKGPAASFNTNLGTGGNFTVTGTLTDGSSPP